MYLKQLMQVLKFDMKLLELHIETSELGDQEKVELKLITNLFNRLKSKVAIIATLSLDN